jgi:hypothetical protein
MASKTEAGGHRGAETVKVSAGADLKTLQDLLGHSSIVITADTYTSVLPSAQRRCADATAKLVLAAARRARDKIRKKGRRNRRDTRPATGTRVPNRPTTGKKPQVTPQPNGRSSRKVVTPASDTRLTPTVHTGRTTRDADHAKQQASGLLFLRARRDSNP